MRVLRCLLKMSRFSTKILHQILFALLLCSLGWANSDKKFAMETCLKDLLLTASEDMTIGEMRASCLVKLSGVEEISTPESLKPNAVEKRLKVDEANVLRPFTIMANKPNYILFAAHNFKGYSVSEFIEDSGDEGFSLDETESQFQLSMKTPLAVNLFDTDIDFFTAYTVRSFWQVYNRGFSSPFRETNHEPDFWIQGRPGFEFLGFKNEVTALGIVHQSNGQSSNLSRSWNRVYANFMLNRGNLAISIKPWVRIKEDLEDDDNPDITDYLGHGELSLAYKYDDNTFSFMSRNNLESGFSKGGVELGWSFPILDYPYLKGYVQYFSGYGESLIDYDRYVNSVGIGISLTDLL